jgi:hypothetical protein
MTIHDMPVWGGIIELIGEEQAACLSAIFGGGSIYIPRHVGAHHPLAECLGHADAVMLVAEFAGQSVPVPIGLGKHAKIRQLRGALSTAEIAKRVGVSRRTVFYVFAQADREARDAEEQLSLPF